MKARSIRGPVAVLVAVVALAATVPIARSARADEPLRSGTIAGGIGFTHPMPCNEAPDCRAWRISGCSEVLTGIDPAWLSSIVDVGALANGVTQRLFEVEAVQPVGHVAGGVVVQAWRSDCTEILSVRRTITNSSTFALPTGANWMTVVGNDNVLIRWWLT